MRWENEVGNKLSPVTDNDLPSSMFAGCYLLKGNALLPRFPKPAHFPDSGEVEDRLGNQLTPTFTAPSGQVSATICRTWCSSTISAYPWAVVVFCCFVLK